MNFLEQLGIESLANRFMEEIHSGFERMEEMMADLQTAVADLQNAVSGVSQRVDALTGPLQEALATAQEELANERQAYADLQTAEDAEDVQQNQALTDAQARTDAALADAQNAADGIESEVSNLNNIAQQTPTEPTPEEPTA